MRTIVFAATKGGTGKSTLAFNLGIEAAQHDSAYWVDLDPQKTLTYLAETRDDEVSNASPTPSLLEDVENLSMALNDLRRSSYQRDFVIVDTPGSHMPIIKNALEAADIIILPVQPSPLDILAQEDVVPLVKEIGKEGRAFFVINRIDARASITDMIERIRPIFPNSIIPIHQRQAYLRSGIRGLSGPEYRPRDCASEIKTLWTAIKIILEG